MGGQGEERPARLERHLGAARSARTGEHETCRGHRRRRDPPQRRGRHEPLTVEDERLGVGDHQAGPAVDRGQLVGQGVGEPGTDARRRQRRLAGTGAADEQGAAPRGPATQAAWSSTWARDSAAIALRRQTTVAAATVGSTPCRTIRPPSAELQAAGAGHQRDLALGSGRRLEVDERRP